MSRKSTYLLILVLSLLGYGARAQEISLTAMVDRESATVGDAVKYSITFTNPPPGTTLSTPDLNGLAVLQGPFDSRSTQIINGRGTMTFTRTWILTATQPGEFTIGAAVGQVGGGQLRTEPIKLRFAKGEGGGSNAAMDQGQKSNRDLFCTITLSKNRVYVGEQVIATYTLYSRYNNLQAGEYDLPKLNGFWAEEVHLGEATWDRTPQTVNGLRYNTVVLKKQVLIPQRSGKLRIEAMELNYRVNPTFFSSGTPVTIRSNATELNVLDLPADKPADFIGAVGELQLTTEMPRTSVKANEAIDLNLRFSGRANLKLIEAPKLSLPTDIEAYDPKIVDKVSVTTGGMSGSREFQYLLIPRSAGEQTLGPITFSYFDPASGSYKRLSTDPLNVTVLPGDGTSAAVTRPRQNEVQQIGTDIRYIRTGDLQLRPHDDRLFGSWAYVAGIATPLLAFLGLATWQRRRGLELADTVAQRRKGADRVARKRLKAAEEALKANDRTGFYSALGKALEGYFADRYDLGVAQVHADMVRMKLGSLEEGRIAQEYVELLDESASARFAPLESKPRQQVYEQAVALIRRIEASPRA
ncbi:MAG TPA: BatD family protein [Flavobacteriales bacterium]